MIYKYELKADTLFLYFDYSFEFSNEFNHKKQTLMKQIKDYIKKMKIKFNGEKIVIVVGGIAIATLLFGNDTLENKNIEKTLENNEPAIEEKIDIDKINEITETNEQLDQIEHVINTTLKEEIYEEEKNNVINIETTDNVIIDDIKSSEQLPITQEKTETVQKEIKEPIYEEVVDNTIYVTINRSNGSVITLDIEKYLIGVIGAEMPASFNIEALKAQAVVARTYALKRIANNQILTDTVSTQAYKDDSELRNMWGVEFDKYYNKIKNAVDSTKGLYLTYNGEYIDAVYHSTSNGKTEDASYVWGNSIPYLKSVDSPWDTSASSYLRTETKDFNTILNVLGIDLNTSDFEILERNSSGRITIVRIGNNTYNGVELRNLLGLRSADFDLSIENGNLVITTRGYGHGVGMSEYGANGMANSGYNYEQILKHYYQGVQISKK